MPLARWSSAALFVLATLLHPAHMQAADEVTVHGLNQAEFSLNDDPDLARGFSRERLENWLDLDFRLDDVLVGFRYEAYQPPERSADEVTEGITQRFAEFDFGRGGARIGNFYGMFGRGLLWRSYEERAIRIDGNMDGVYFWGGLGSISAQVFSGRVNKGREELNRERKDVLWGADVETELPHGVVAGASYLLQTDHTMHEEAVAGRLSYSHDYFDLYGEAARINRLHGGGRSGTGYYGALSAYPFSFLSFTLEYKEYNHFRFSPIGEDKTENNNPPALSRENSYTLITRNPHQLDTGDEKGFQLEVISTPIEGSTVTVNRTETTKVTGDLLRHSGLKFQEWYGEWRQEVGEGWIIAVAYDYLEDKLPTKNHTPVLDIECLLDGDWGVRGEYQFQQQENELGEITRDHLVLLEIHASYDLIVSAVAEHAQSVRPGDPPLDDYLYGQIDYRISENNFITVTAGKRQGGFVCIGGVCRLVPPLEGAEVILLTSF